MRDRHDALKNDVAAVERVLADGALKANAVAQKKMAQVRSAIGVR